jgi:hypothetical protein
MRHDMQGLLFRNWYSKVNGAVIDAFEYFIKILEYNPDFYLIIIDGLNFSPIIEAFENRYYLNDINYKDNILYVSRYELMCMSFDKVLVLDYATINVTRGLIKTKEIIVISDLHTDDPNYFYNKSLYNVTYYGEMPFVYKDIDYRMKCLFDRFKKIDTCDVGYYINSPFNNEKSFVEKLGLRKNVPIYFKAEDHVKNFFELFDCYIYYHANKWFDPHPRLFLECSYYGKEIQYYNEPNIIDGSYYRYQDLKTNALNNRTLTKDDEIVRLFI